jgi:hypothetical protein
MQRVLGVVSESPGRLSGGERAVEPCELLNELQFRGAGAWREEEDGWMTGGGRVVSAVTKESNHGSLHEASSLAVSIREEDNRAQRGALSIISHVSIEKDNRRARSLSDCAFSVLASGQRW